MRWGAIRHETFFKQLLQEACLCSGLPMEFVGHVYDDLVRKDVCGISGCPVIDIFATGLKDSSLKPALEKAAPGAILFTGGGLVSKDVFAIPGMRIIHIHPGYLPFVRGADGLLYSILLRGRPGASAFYMVPGLDEGDVILKKEFMPFQVEKSRSGGWTISHSTGSCMVVLIPYFAPAYCSN